LGMPVTAWGEGAMRATKPIGEVMA
jgi:hypothetical protein